MDDIIIVGAGIGGLTLALQLQQAGIACRVIEAAPVIAPLGAGVNLLPHASAVLAGLGLGDELASRAVTTRESAYFNRYGQLIYREPAGRFAGHDHPQFSIHRADLQDVLLTAVQQRIGAVESGWTCTGARDRGSHVEVALVRTDDPANTRLVTGSGVVGADGIHSAIRRQLHPGEPAPRHSGVMMWRGLSVWEPCLSGATMVRAGWLSTGKLVAYPVRELGDGRQLVNWVAELEHAEAIERDWNREGRFEDFAGAFADWHFDWLDVPALLRAAPSVLVYPMVDQEPLPWWTSGRITLLGDAAHPMVPRGSNGAGQAVLDTVVLRRELERADLPEAFRAYEGERRPATAAVVLANRVSPPDAILREVYERTGDRPFGDVDDVINRSELAAIVDGYRSITGMAR